jgi:hypothetical protein
MSIHAEEQDQNIGKMKTMKNFTACRDNFINAIAIPNKTRRT